MIPEAQLLRDYETMWVIRRFEETLKDLYGTGVIRGTSHFCAGQEATEVGATAALRPDDLVTSTHRGHGHFIAKGGDPRRIMAELWGKATGYACGRGGSQHMADFAIGFLGSNGITGGMIPVATGAALSQKVLGTGKVVLCFFGDGATGQGAFHEAVNMGAIWKLPVVYLCENNLYAMSTPVEEAFAEPEIAKRAAAYGLPGRRVDGQDYFAVREALAEAAQRARDGDGPTLIEAMTYRIYGHSKSDECAYRTQQEEAAWADRDALKLMREALLTRGVLTEALDAEVRARAEQTIQDAIRFADESPEPCPTTLYDGLLCE
ncbi:MAG: thiamine pyrophosphate-dependent dehydrogenase E1 component subunit alpha [Armatimonadetes bacterium]|nr:thiamine pyrophosphate-dependent dehydrogenase E1 component subunit alpha [Armatimonadota bacterium]